MIIYLTTPAFSTEKGAVPGHRLVGASYHGHCCIMLDVIHNRASIFAISLEFTICTDYIPPYTFLMLSC